MYFPFKTRLTDVFTEMLPFFAIIIFHMVQYRTNRIIFPFNLSAMLTGNITNNKEVVTKDGCVSLVIGASYSFRWLCITSLANTFHYNSLRGKIKIVAYSLDKVVLFHLSHLSHLSQHYSFNCEQ